MAPIDLMIARAEDELATIKYDALAKRVIALERSLPVETVILAQRVADVLRVAVPGFDVYVTRAPVKSWTFPEDSTAIVVIAEPGIERTAATGLVSGKVTILTHRPNMYRAIPPEAVETAAKAQRLALSVVSNVKGSSSEPAGYVTDELRIEVRHVIDGHAVIRKVDLSSLPTRTWVEQVYASNGGYPTGLPGTDRPYRWGVTIGRHTVATGHGPSIDVEEVNSDGIRTLVVTQTINTMNTDPADFGEGLREAIALDHGYTYQGMGVLVDSEVRLAGGIAEQRTTNWQIRLTFESAIR